MIDEECVVSESAKALEVAILFSGVSAFAPTVVEMAEEVLWCLNKLYRKIQCFPNKVLLIG